jgi:hypothetical protein
MGLRGKGLSGSPPEVDDLMPTGAGGLSAASGPTFHQDEGFGMDYVVQVLTTGDVLAVLYQEPHRISFRISVYPNKGDLRCSKGAFTLKVNEDRGITLKGCL